MEMDIRHYLTKATAQRDCEALQSAHRLMKAVRENGGSGRTPRISPELHVICAEAALQLRILDISTVSLKMYFEDNPPADQFLCRAYLCQGHLKSLSASGNNVEDFDEAVEYFLKAIEISKHDPRYHYIAFNASVLYFQTVRPLLQPGRYLHLVRSLRQVVQSLEEVADQDHSWRAELMMLLIKCVVDAGKMEDAADLGRITEEFINTHTPHLYPRLFMLLVQHNLKEDDAVSEMIQQESTLEVIYKIQEFKNRVEEINENTLTKEDSAKLEEIYHLLVDFTKASTVPVNHSHLHSPVPIQPADRVAFLLELALLALQVKHQKVSVDCLTELKLVKEACVGQRIVMKCINSEINLLKKGVKMNDYSKASVKAWLKEIGKLDQWLQCAVSEGDPRAVQAVCAVQWRFCLPLLQHNLRKQVRTPLLRVSQGLEDIQSLLLEMRCQIHSEIAVIEEEEGLLEASLTHLQKAILLDNGTQRERLSSALHLLQLRGTLYQTPSRTEDKAAMLLQQSRDIDSQEKRDIRPILVAVGLLLGPDEFQIVLDGDKVPADMFGSGPLAQLSAKAQHHTASLQSVDGHLIRRDSDTDSTERMKLWATLVKTARKYQIWDVCRAASRFCLLYDNGRWKNSKEGGKNIPNTDECRCSEDENCAECPHDYNSARDCLRLLAEIYFISAEATVQRLSNEGVQLNSPPVPPQEPGLHVSEEDPHWITYRDWVQDLSAYATSNFLRAAELGSEIREPWLVANAAIYLWNYSNHLLAAGEYRRLLSPFQSLVEMLRKLECPGNHVVDVLLCNAVARGLIEPVCGLNGVEPILMESKEKSKNRTEKGMEKTAGVHGVFLHPAALQDVKKALELCDYALHISNCNIPGERVPIAAKKQVVATWVQIKMLLQQKIDVKDECGDEGESAITRVLVGVEMLQWNRNLGHMEFSSAPSLSTLVTMASESSWTDVMAELQVWCQLAAFCHSAKEHSLVLRCTDRALQLEDAAAQSIDTMHFLLNDLTAVNEMLSSAACLRGLSLVHGSNGDLQTYREALNMLLSSVSYAEKAENPVLCVTAVRHYWNTCLPLTQNPEERWKLQEPLEKILNALLHTATKRANKRVKAKGSLTLRGLALQSPIQEATDEEDLTMRAAIYSLLLHIHIDKTDCKGALQLLAKANRDMPHPRHRLPLLKQFIMLKARQGENILMDMQMLQDEGEQCCSLMWHQAALCAGSITQRLTCYQKSITSLLDTESRWQKVNLVLEFGEWLYCHNFPKASAQHQVQWATDILLHLEPEQADGAVDQSTKSQLEHKSLVGVHGLLFRENPSSLKEVRRLDCLVRAHTLLAVMADRSSPERQLNLLRAYTFVLQIWQVSIAAVNEISCDMPKSQLLNNNNNNTPPSAGSTKGKDKSQSKKDVKTTPAEERPKPVVLDQTLPSCPEEWARYSCPEQARQIFRGNTNPRCVSIHSIPNQTQSIFYLNLLEKELHSLSLDHLVLPIVHLAETIAHDVLERGDLADLYRLRILRICSQLGLETYSPYRENLPNLCRIQEQEQMKCHRAAAILKETQVLYKTNNQKVEQDVKVGSEPQSINISAQDIWLEKAEVCLSMGLHQFARQLLAEAHLVARELGDQKAVAKCFLSLATLACDEQNHSQARILLDKAHVLGGDEDFWYQFTLTKLSAVVDQTHQDAQTEVDQIIKQGCEALKLVLEQHVNRVSELTFMITSLEMRGALECIRASGGGEPGVTLCHETVQRLMAACETLRECAINFTKLSYGQQAADAHVEYAQGMRILANHATNKEEKRCFLLHGLSQMQLAVTVQEHVVLNVQSLLTQQKETCGMSLAAVRRLLRLRLALAEFSLAGMEEQCAEEKCQAVARERKTSAEITLEEYTRCTPEPSSTEQEWMSVGVTLGQVAVGQLSAVSSHSFDNMETRARCLSLMGKCLRLQAVQEDPVYVCSLWDEHKHTKKRRNSQSVKSIEIISLSGNADTNTHVHTKGYRKEASFKPISVDENSEKEKERQSSGKEPRMTSGKSAELKQRRLKAQQLLAKATKVLDEAVSLCLQHNLPSFILADASINLLDCYGRSEPALAGQSLALFQTCCTASGIAEALSSACADTSVSQLSALLSLHRKLLLSQEERPSSMLKGVEDSLKGLSKAFRQRNINPNHRNILAELPPSLKILLLQHSEDGSELYGAFYETNRVPENQKEKTTQLTGNLMCSKLAKISVCPQALLALREQIQAFSQETRHALSKEVSGHDAEVGLEASEKQQKTASDVKLTPNFCKIVQDVEDYLLPLLIQFDFSRSRPQAASEPHLETTKRKDEEKGSTIKSLPDPGEHLVLLADRKLLDLPLESLPILQDEGLSSVSRDFSLQLLHSRLNRNESEKVGSDNKKETRGGKGSKGRGDQSQSIKVIPASPSDTFTVDTRNLKYIVDPYSDGNYACGKEWTTLTRRMTEVLEAHSKHTSKQITSLSEMEQLLCKCSALIYLGREHFFTNIPPAKLAALDTSECRMALLFEQNDARPLHQSLHTTHKSARHFSPGKSQETALLLSLGGVSCVVLHQWPSSFQQNMHNMATVLDNLLSGRQTSGQTIHALRKRSDLNTLHHTVTATAHDPVLITNEEGSNVPHKRTHVTPSNFNCVIYGLPNLIFI